MTRDERIVEAYRAGNKTMRDLGREWDISHVRVAQILRAAGVVNMREQGRPRSPIPDYMRRTFVGDATLTPLQIADAVRGRLERAKSEVLIYVLCERGRVYAPFSGPVLAEFVEERSDLLIGCYRKGFDVRDLAADVEAMREAA